MRQSRIKKKIDLASPLSRRGTSYDRWVLSYADFVTLIFAVFVVMYSVSQINEKKFDYLIDGLSNTFEFYGRDTQSQGGLVAANHPEVSFNNQVLPFLEQTLASYTNVNVDLFADEQWIVLHLPSDILFDPGQAILSKAAYSEIDAVFSILQRVNSEIAIEGHTDNVPISNEQYSSNWALSSARAVSLLEVIEAKGINSKWLLAVGYADRLSIGKNDTSEGRALNRRVTIRFKTNGLALDEIKPAPLAPLRSNQNSSIDEAKSEEVSPETVSPIELNNGAILFTNFPERHQHRIEPSQDETSSNLEDEHE